MKRGKTSSPYLVRPCCGARVLWEVFFRKGSVKLPHNRGCKWR